MHILASANNPRDSALTNSHRLNSNVHVMVGNTEGLRNTLVKLNFVGDENCSLGALFRQCVSPHNAENAFSPVLQRHYHKSAIRILQISLNIYNTIHYRSCKVVTHVHWFVGVPEIDVSVVGNPWNVDRFTILDTSKTNALKSANLPSIYTKAKCEVLGFNFRQQTFMSLKRALLRILSAWSSVAAT